VEALEYASAHRMAAIMLIFSFLVLLALYAWRSEEGKKY
jgi:molybdate transport system permease protein